jgi:hypothetical protein
MAEVAKDALPASQERGFTMRSGVFADFCKSGDWVLVYSLYFKMGVLWLVLDAGRSL